MVSKTKGGLADKFDSELLTEFAKKHQLFEKIYLEPI